jgi:ABC-type branched-subunit amino acid transport system substrate-binding protein
MATTNRALTILLLALALCACGGKSEPAPAAEAPAEPGAPAAEAVPAGPKTDVGVDLATKTIRIGTLNDESGPAATIGKPYAIGKRVLAAQINAGGSGLLPDGWKLELVEKDHGYNPQKSVQAYNQIKDQVLFIATSFGTPNTLPLRPMLERDKMIALPASLSSEMAKHKYTIPGGTSYEIGAMRGMDHVIATAKDKAKIKAGIIYQQDDYGMDGLNGWKAAANHHGVTIVNEQTITPGQKDFAAVITALKSAGATHVLLTVLPSATGPILGTAAQLRYAPSWVGMTPTWIDAFFNPEVIPSKVFDTFEWISVLPYWGEKVPGMEGFVAAYEKFGKEMGPPDFYILFSYVQGLYACEMLKRAIAANDLSRDGLMAAAQGIADFTGGGLLQPISSNTFPYVTSTKARILKPDFAAKTWTLVSDYAAPQMAPGAAAPAPAAAAPEAPAAAPDAPK